VNAAAADFRLRPGSPCAPLLDHPDLPGTDPLPVPGINPVAPPIGARFGLAQGQQPGGPAAGGLGGRKVTLRALRRSVRLGRQVRLTGRVLVASRRKVRIELRRRGRWTRVRALAQAGDGTFGTRLRVHRQGRRKAVALRRVRLPRRARVLVLRAAVPGVGRSRAVRVRLRR
jgi:hypothetical protein